MKDLTTLTPALRHALIQDRQAARGSTLRSAGTLPPQHEIPIEGGAHLEKASEGRLQR